MARITVSVGRDPPRVWTDGAAPAARPATAPAIDVQARAFFAQRRPSRTHGLTPGAGGDRFSGTARAGEGRWAALLLAGVGTVPPGQGRGWLDGGERGLTQGPELGAPLLSGFLSPRGVSSLSVCLLPAGGWGAEKGPPGHTLPWGCPAAPFLWISKTEAHRLTEPLPPASQPGMGTRIENAGSPYPFWSSHHFSRRLGGTRHPLKHAVALGECAGRGRCGPRGSRHGGPDAVTVFQGTPRL